MLLCKYCPQAVWLRNVSRGTIFFYVCEWNWSNSDSSELKDASSICIYTLNLFSFTFWSGHHELILAPLVPTKVRARNHGKWKEVKLIASKCLWVSHTIMYFMLLSGGVTTRIHRLAHELVPAKGFIPNRGEMFIYTSRSESVLFWKSRCCYQVIGNPSLKKLTRVADQWYSIGIDFVPLQGHLAMYRNVFGCHSWGVSVLLASGG